MNLYFCRFRGVAAAFLAVLAILGSPPAASAADMVIFAAASLKEALDDATRVYDAQTGDIVRNLLCSKFDARQTD
jgi:ABC-type molybdate transport system substrate-binding protein